VLQRASLQRLRIFASEKPTATRRLSERYAFRGIDWISYFFIKDRLKFATYFFENATKPFVGLISAIEKEEPPFVPVYDESRGPQYLQEWQDARTGFESVGLTALSMVASSLHLFF